MKQSIVTNFMIQFVNSCPNKNQSSLYKMMASRNPRFCTEHGIERMFRQLLLVFILSFCLFYSQNGFAQNWQVTVPELEDIVKVLQLDDGNFVALGRVGEPNINGNDDIGLVKLDADGNLLWFQQFDEYADQDIGFDMIRISNGGFLIAGQTNSFFDFSPNVIFLKTDESGNKIWEKVYSITNTEKPYGLIETADGGFAFTGCFNCESFRETIFCKIDVNGNLMFHKYYDGFSEGRALIETTQGFIIVGWKDLLNGNSRDLHVIKTYPDGNFHWEQTFNSPGDDFANAILKISDDSFVLVGTKDFDAENSGNIALIKMNINGDILWENYYETNWPDEADALAIDNQGNFLIAGTSFHDPANNGDVVLMKTNPQGDIFWTQYFGDNLNWSARDVIVTQNGNYAIAGVTQLLNDENAPVFSDGFLLLTDDSNVQQSGMLSGYVFHDGFENCFFDANETPLANWIVRATQDTNVFYATTDENGYYSMQLDSGSYVLDIVLNNSYWTPCQPSYNLEINNQDQTLYFPMQNLLGCPLLEVDVSTPVLIPCTDQTYTFSYCNHGTETAPDAELIVEFDPNLTIQNSDLPFESDVPNELVFSLGDIPIGNCNTFSVGTSLSCSVLPGAAHCVSAHIYPDSICEPAHPLWNRASIAVEGECINDTVFYRISNVGEQGMTYAQEFIIIEDHIIYNVGPFELEVGEEIVVPRFSGGKFSRIEADQALYHPGLDAPSASIEACGDNPSLGILTQYPQNDADLFVSIDCQENTTPSGVLTLSASPAGFFDEHFIAYGQEIEYHLLFQNTVADTVFRVVLQDTLSPYLDLATVRPGTSSHPYQFDITEDGIITFTFDEIALVNNDTNPEQSRGFVKFKAQQLPDLLPGIIIENRASCFFNSGNDAFSGNPYFHTLKRPYRVDQAVEQLCPGEPFNGVVYEENAMVLDTFVQENFDSIVFYNIEVLSDTFTETVQYLHIDEDFLGEQIENDTTIERIYTAVNGCDSVVEYSIFRLPVEYNYADTTICEGDEINGVICNQDTTIVDTLFFDTMDIIHTNIVYVNPNVFRVVDTTLTPTTPLFGTFYDADTTIVIEYETVYNCDSLVVYNIDITTGTTELPGIHALTVTPNPSRENFTINYYLSEAQEVTIELFDASGKKTSGISKQYTHESGYFNYEVEGKQLEHGVYILVIKTAQGQLTRRLIKL